MNHMSEPKLRAGWNFQTIENIKRRNNIQSVRGLARSINFSPDTLRWQLNQDRPSIEAATAISFAFNVGYDALLQKVPQ